MRDQEPTQDGPTSKAIQPDPKEATDAKDPDVRDRKRARFEARSEGDADNPLICRGID